MKTAMWKVDSELGFRFSDADNPDQPVLFSNDDAWLPVLKKDILEAFKEANNLNVESVRLFVEDQTAYLDTHMKRALKSLEAEAIIRVNDIKTDGKKRRAGTFPDGAVISFKNVQRELF